MAAHDQSAWSDMLSSLRNANHGFAITIWTDSADGEAGWQLWPSLDAKYAEKSPGWLMTIPGDQVLDAIAALAAGGHPCRATTKLRTP